MEVSDELRTKPLTQLMPDASENPVNSENAKVSSECREEGELSSDSDDELPAGSPSHFTTSSTAGLGLNGASSVRKDTGTAKVGNYHTINNASNFVNVPSGTSALPNHQKSCEKNRGSFVPFLISFSDDESGSDSGECRQGEGLKSNGNTSILDGSRRLPATQVRSQTLQRATGNNVIAGNIRQPSFNRTSVSSMTNKINEASSRNSGALSSKKRQHVGNRSLLNNRMAVQAEGLNQSAQSNTSKLQDLRQQIAIRKHELKLKEAWENKKTMTGFHGDNNVRTSRKDAEGFTREVSAEYLQFEQPKEPERKRLKVGEPYPSHLISNTQQYMPAHSRLALEKSVLENDNLHHIDGRGHVGGTSLDSAPSGISQTQKQDKNRGPISNLPSGVEEGADTNNSQRDRTTKLPDPSAGILTRSDKATERRNNVGLEHPGELKCHNERNIPNKASSRYNIIIDNNLLEVGSGEKSVKLTSNDKNQPSPCHFPDGNQKNHNNACHGSGNLCNCSGEFSVPGSSNMDIQSLLDIEELHDKELNEAQEYRRTCEIEEINALKSYRKAQRALAEVNARCSYLYRKRELYSAHYRSLIMGNSSLLWSSKPCDHVGAGLNSSIPIPEDNMHLVSTSSCQMAAGLDAYKQHGRDSNIHSANGAFQNMTDQLVEKQNLASNPLSEHDANALELHNGKDVVNAVSSPSNDLNISADDEEETFSFKHKTDQSDLDCQRKQEVHEGVGPEINEESQRNFSSNSLQDSILLEASLRSQLFARLGMRTSLNKGVQKQGVQLTVESRSQNDDGQEKAEMHVENVPFIETEKAQHSDHGDSSTSMDDYQSIVSSSILSPIVKSAFNHLKEAQTINLVQLEIGSPQLLLSDICNKEDNDTDSNTIKLSIISSKSTAEEVGSYTNNIAVDPFWPLCMYELRGKCNNDGCPLQHFRDGSFKMLNNDHSDCPDSQAKTGKFSGVINHPGGVNCLSLSPPSYLVCLDTLKSDLYQHKSVLLQSVGECWQKFFSAFLVLARWLPSDLPPDEPFLHGNEARLEVHGCWNRRSLYFHSKNGAVGQHDKEFAGIDESLEMALLNLNQEVDKGKGRIEALKVLARTLEANPASEVLWIVYLHIYYGNQKSIGNDDMFHFAVKNNERSYELWIMYINSRILLDDRMAAYDTAIAALCRYASASVGDVVYVSQCILDLFLQMMNCLCISGNVGRATEKICQLYTSIKESVDHHLLLSDILTCMTVADKCTFWVCCVYMVIYRKLPDAMLHQLECQKELTTIWWPPLHLTVDEKQQAVMLMEMAVDSLSLYIDSESLESETTLRAAHLFAINHIRCIAVLEGSECSRGLLGKYTRLYPSCLELVLMSAQPQENDFGDICFGGFEQALDNWLEEVPGIQCIWNQYAECAFQLGRFDFVKELMNRWFQSVWKINYPEHGNLTDGKNFHALIGSALTSAPNVFASNSSQIDVAFALLNLSLHLLLQNNHIEARLAVDRALKAATAEDYKHFVGEHSMVLRICRSELSKCNPAGGLLNMLHSYLVDARSFPAFEPLSRKFIQSIKKLRVRQLVCNLLSPISSNFSLVNLVLQVWYGPSLLPHSSGKLKDLVDLVEAVMEVVPSNYPLAISVCKLLAIRSSPQETLPSSITFWASSLLVTALCQAVPVAPEYVWVEAAETLRKLTDIQSISESFHKRALTVYPFSIKLWKSYVNVALTRGNVNAVIQEAEERGIKVD